MPRAPVDSMGPMLFNSKDKRAPLLHQTPSSPYDSMVMDDMHGVSKQLPIAEIKHRHFILGCQAGLALQMFIMVLIMMATVIHTVLSLLPFWIRLMQCFRAFADSREPGKAICAGGLRSAAPRHLFNAGKYTASLAVALLSVGVTPFGEWGLSDAVWAGVSLFSSVYSFLWDVFIDWGLRLPIGESKYSAAASSRRFVYHSWFYPFAICTNAAARLSWAVYISPGQTLLKRHWVLLIAGIELLRRAQWALLRLEHENSLAQCQCYIHAREAALRRPRSSTL